MSLKSGRQLTVEGLEPRMLLAADLATLAEPFAAPPDGHDDIQAFFADAVPQVENHQSEGIPKPDHEKEQGWPDIISIPVGFESEGIELGEGHDFFLGGTSWSGDLTNAGAIYKGDLRTGEGEILVKGTGKPLGGLSYDARTNYLYATTGDPGVFAGNFKNQGVNIYDVSKGELVREVIFGDNILINDILVTNKAVYATDSINAALYKIPLEKGGKPNSAAWEKIEMTGFVMSDNGLGFNANGLVGDFDGKELVIVNINTGVLYKVNTESGEAIPIDVHGEQITFEDGDGLYMNGRTLYIMQNFLNKIAVVQLSRDLTHGKFVKDIVSDDFAIPTTIIGFRDSIYAINTNFCQITTFCGLEPQDPTQFQTEVVKVPQGENQEFPSRPLSEHESEA